MHILLRRSRKLLILHIWNYSVWTIRNKSGERLFRTEINQSLFKCYNNPLVDPVFTPVLLVCSQCCQSGPLNVILICHSLLKIIQWHPTSLIIQSLTCASRSCRISFPLHASLASPFSLLACCNPAKLSFPPRFYSNTR